MEEKYKWINIINIVWKGKLPINKKSFDFAISIKNGDIDINDIPPILLEQLPNGEYLLRGGRHRYVAYRLNNLDRIYAKVFKRKF